MRRFVQVAPRSGRRVGAGYIGTRGPISMFGGKAILAFLVFWVICLLSINNLQFMEGLTSGGIFCGICFVVLTKRSK